MAAIFEIPMRMAPALATPGRFMLASVRTGYTVEDDTGRARLFESQEMAVQFLREENKRPQNLRKYILVHSDGTEEKL